MTPRTHKVFVYGSLLSGLYNNTVLTHDRYSGGKFRGKLFARLVPKANPGRLVGKATTATRWTLFDLGSFPAAVPGGLGPIKGEVWEVDDNGLDALDRLEGYHPGEATGLYDRREVRLRGGSKALIYFMPKPVSAAVKVPSGDWRKYAATRTDAPSYAWMFSEDASTC